MQDVADRRQSGEPDRFGPVVFQHRQVHQADTDLFAQVGQGHAPRFQELIEPAVDVGGVVSRHPTSPSASFWIRRPYWKTAATSTRTIPSIRGPVVNLASRISDFSG